MTAQRIMDQSQDNLSPAGSITTMQIIAGTLMGGVTMFAVVAIVMSLGKPPGEPMIAYIAVGFTAMAFVSRFVVPGVFVGSHREKFAGQSRDELNMDEVSKSFLAVYQTKMIVEMALLEGPAFFCLIAYISSVQWWLLAVTGSLLLVMAAGFPTTAKVEHWIEDQIQMLNLEM